MRQRQADIRTVKIKGRGHESRDSMHTAHHEDIDRQTCHHKGDNPQNLHTGDRIAAGEKGEYCRCPGDTRRRIMRNGCAIAMQHMRRPARIEVALLKAGDHISGAEKNTFPFHREREIGL